MLRAYKFLDASGRSPFTGTPWEIGTWVESATVAECREGVHACRVEHLSYWIAPSLWEVELDGEIVEGRHKVAASRGRLVRRLDDYHAALDELNEVCAWRARDCAVEALRAAGDNVMATRFATASTLDALRALGAEVDDGTHSGGLAAYAADVAVFAMDGPVPDPTFVAACSAGQFAAGPEGDQATFDAAFAAERTVQSLWLAARLGLTSA
jgi:hypothetical protein